MQFDRFDFEDLATELLVLPLHPFVLQFEQTGDEVGQVGLLGKALHALAQPPGLVFDSVKGALVLLRENGVLLDVQLKFVVHSVQEGVQLDEEDLHETRVARFAFVEPRKGVAEGVLEEGTGRCLAEDSEQVGEVVKQTPERLAVQSQVLGEDVGQVGPDEGVLVEQPFFLVDHRVVLFDQAVVLVERGLLSMVGVATLVGPCFVLRFQVLAEQKEHSDELAGL